MESGYFRLMPMSAALTLPYRLPAAFTAVAVLWAASASAAPNLNGFDLEEASIPPEQILRGGPPRDGIPAIDDPHFESSSEAGWLQDGDMVIGVERNGIARAYPISILNWHEIVNDDFGGEPVLVTFCPLCGTGIVFSPPRGGDFGVSGLLYNSDVLLYDRETESLWSQILAEAVTGERKGERLAVIPSRHVRWASWRERWPGTEVLSRDTGFARDYGRDPYSGYDRSAQVFFPLANIDQRSGLHPKERVLGIEVGGGSKAYPYSALAERGEESFADRVGGEEVRIHWDQAGPAAWASREGEELPAVTGFWFAWYAFHPDTEVFAP